LEGGEDELYVIVTVEQRSQENHACDTANREVEGFQYCGLVQVKTAWWAMHYPA
jgi:hypothetical protein